MKRIMALCIAIILLICYLPVISGAVDVNADLRKAAENGQLEDVQQLLMKGASVNSPDEKGRTALMLAAEKGHVDVVKVLLTGGADIQCADKKGERALDKAKDKKKQEVVELLELEIAWAKAKSANTITSYELFIDTYKGSSYVALARVAIDSLNWREASQKNTMGAYWIYMQGDDPKQFMDTAKKEFDQKLQTSESIAIEPMMKILNQVLLPFTLDEVSSSVSAQTKPSSGALVSFTGTGNSSTFSMGGMDIQSTSQSRTVGGIKYQVTVQKVMDKGRFIKVEVYVKEGTVTVSDMYQGKIGDRILSLYNPVPKSSGNEIGFETIIFFAGDVRGCYIVSDGKAYKLSF